MKKNILKALNFQIISQNFRTLTILTSIKHDYSLPPLCMHDVLLIVFTATASKILSFSGVVCAHIPLYTQPNSPVDTKYYLCTYLL